MADLESSIQFWPKHSTTLQCDKMKLLCRVFRSANFSFRQKKAIKFEIWTLFTCLKEIYQFLGGWFGKLLSGLAQTFQDPLVSQNETPVKVFWLSIFTFQTKESNKIWTLFACLKEIYQFWGGWFGKLLSVLANTFRNPSVSQKKTPVGSFTSGCFPFKQKTQ